ncbi:MAG: 3-isopropylmalate dehydrogenase [Myxococcales bacterium]|nr:3-isopropylmalate dehydrogenase [Myxococcales bacterium]
MAERIAVIGGDGIGPEVTEQARRIVDRAAQIAQRSLEWEECPYGADYYLEHGVGIEPGRFDDFREHYAAILFGAVGDPRVPDMAHGRELLLGARFQLDLYINLRPIKLLDPRLCPLKDKGVDDVDFVIFRENTEGGYVGVGGAVRPGTIHEVAQQTFVYTRRGVERIIRSAFEFAQRDGRKSVCMTDKANAMRQGHELWQRTFREVASEYPKIESFHLYVDVAAMELVRCPERFDVIVTENLFGDILSDLGASLQGGLGTAASGNIHPGRCSLFEPVHGSAPDLVGTGRANPMAAIMSGAILLDHLGMSGAARTVEQAVIDQLASGEVTPDLGGNLNCVQVGDQILARLG